MKYSHHFGAKSFMFNWSIKRLLFGAITLINCGMNCPKFGIETIKKERIKRGK